MKKLSLVLAILVTSFVLIPVAAIAAPQTYDLETMTIDELVKLRSAINRTISERNKGNAGEPSPTPAPTPAKPKKVTVPQGSYTVGIDIPAGSYSMSIDGSGIGLASVVIYSGTNKDDFTNYENTYMITPDKPVGRVTLESGFLVEIGGDNVIFRPAQKLGF